MIFQRGKSNKDASAVARALGDDGDSRALESATIERWRKVAQQAKSSREQNVDFDDNFEPLDWNPGQEMPEFPADPVPLPDDQTNVLRTQPLQESFLARFTTKSKIAERPEERSFEVEEMLEPAPEIIAAEIPERVVSARDEPVEDSAVRIIAASNVNLPVDDDLKRRFGTNVKSALGPGTVVEGKFKFDSPVRIDGSLTGDVQSNSVLIVGEQATVEGEIKVGSLVVLGQVSGTVQATDLIEIRATGRLEADISTERITIEDGGFFKGRCNS